MTKILITNLLPTAFGGLKPERSNLLLSKPTLMKSTTYFIVIPYYLLFAFLLLLDATARLPFSAPLLQAQPLLGGDNKECDNRWTVPQIRLKDHTFFEYEGDFYFASIVLSNKSSLYEKTFAYARTSDFCSWQNRGFILKVGREGSADEFRIWAPYVIQEGDTYYLFYTGVNRNIAQSMMLATSTNPAEPLSWQKQGLVFRPNHEGMVYPGEHTWSDNRDPMVLKYEGYYYLFYTGLDVDGGIVGVAKASSLSGAWEDLGAILPAEADAMLESPFVLSKDGFFYLYYNNTKLGGTEWRSSHSPFGPWEEPIKEDIGWAHDFGLVDEKWYASYVIGNGEAVGLSPLKWLPGTPPAPYLESHLFMPLIVK
jgi:hypothetical protein